MQHHAHLCALREEEVSSQYLCMWGCMRMQATLCGRHSTAIAPVGREARSFKRSPVATFSTAPLRPTKPTRQGLNASSCLPWLNTSACSGQSDCKAVVVTSSQTAPVSSAPGSLAMLLHFARPCLQAGGAVFQSGCASSISFSIFSSNTVGAAGTGGAVYRNACHGYTLNCTFQSNTASLVRRLHHHHHPVVGAICGTQILLYNGIGQKMCHS